MTNVDVMLNSLLSRIEKLEKQVAELQSEILRMHRTTMMYESIGSTKDVNFGGGESRDYKK